MYVYQNKSYNINTALQYLKPANTSQVSNPISLIAASAFNFLSKVWNYLFGDHVWYSEKNMKAVLEDYRTTTGNIEKQLDQAMRSLHEQLNPGVAFISRHNPEKEIKEKEQRIKTTSQTKNHPDEFDEEASDKLASTGELIYYPKEAEEKTEKHKDRFDRPSCYLHYMLAGKKGFGTAAFRKVVKRSIQAGFDGRVHLDAAYSSHSFHLEMGMIPMDAEDDLIFYNKRKSDPKVMAIKAFPTIFEKMLSHIPLDKTEKQQVYLLKEILVTHNKEQAVNIDKNKEYEQKDIESLPDSIICDNEAIFYNLSDKMSKPLFRSDFIWKFLEVWENSTEKFPNTKSLGSRWMVMSAEGIERWKKAIAEKKPFVPFKKFEHLRNYMNSKQIEQMNRILQVKEKALPIQNVVVS